MKKWNIALGFYQVDSTAHAVLAALKKKKYSRFALIHHKRGGDLEIISGKIDPEVVDQFKNRVIVDEILVIVQVDRTEVRDVLAILRQVKSGHPVTFLLRPDIDGGLQDKRHLPTDSNTPSASLQLLAERLVSAAKLHLASGALQSVGRCLFYCKPPFEEENIEIPFEPLTVEQQHQEAAKLAASLQESNESKDYSRSLLKLIQKSHETLLFIRADIADAEYIEQTILSSAEWLLDNMYVVEGSIEDVKLNLPKKYYRELPKILNGSLAGFPRIYALAVELVKNCSGRLTREIIINFLDAYQNNHPLTIGELWAFPLMLRLRLIEWVEFLAIHVDNRMREGELASFWGHRLIYAAHHEPGRLPLFLADLSSEQTTLSGHFAEELLDHLFDEESVLPLIREWLEKSFDAPLADILHQEHIHETSEQVVFSNSIRSLITLSQLSWPDIFETVSTVDTILREDPAGIYAKMDFASRNSYRESIEELSRRTHEKEVEVARKTLALAHEGKREFEKHIGYYLVDAGRQVLEQKIGYKPKFLQWIRRKIINHPAIVYLGGIALITLLLEVALFSAVQSFLFVFLSLLPISELSVQLMNLFLTMILPATLRHKMSFETGIPKEYKTLVVVPMILQNSDSIRDEIEKLEIRYLANTDPFLYFALFSDFMDAPEKQTEKDAHLLSVAVEGLKNLESKYGEGNFFLFHRKRSWSKSEKAWIGWERKRGKLEYLNRFLMGEKLSENIVYMGKEEVLKGIRYVITLDTDTQLSKDQARSLIEVLSHPLNRPYLNADKKSLKRGYTIIQPRVSTDFIHSKASLFCKIFSEPTALDPYTQAVSNVYQDLSGEGFYHGKGIFDVEAFHSILSKRFPEEHLLSHDLIEGAFVRVGFASHICLFDMHPKDYLSWSNRKHRWIRGDWQIIDWLFPNSLSWMNWWKIFDNLRRALLPIALTLLLICGWIISSRPEIWTGLALLVLLLPCLSLAITKLFSYSFAAIKSLFIDLKILLLRSLITLALLPYEAYVSLDAMVRVAYRRLISHCHLLQWTSCEHTCNGLTKAHRHFVLKLGGVSLFAILVAGSVNPQAFWMALPLCCLWFISPLIVYLIDLPLEKQTVDEISDEDQKTLREIAHKTWSFFDELVGPQTHWLPPDNYQTALNVEIAQRTSPTNIGMWLMALMSAYDFKFITCDNLIDKALATIHQLKNLERHEGHFLNWYNIQTLDPLFPRYVSTVDSGNLIACMWTLSQGLIEMLSTPIIPNNPGNELKGLELIHSRYFDWVGILTSLSDEQLHLIDPEAAQWRAQALSWKPSLQMLSSENILSKFHLANLPDEIKEWGKKLQEAYSTAQWFAGEKIGLVNEIIHEIDQFSKEMNLKFLYNKERKLFVIGYNVDERKLDSSYYDLLASEARIASLVAIAKEDIPLEHWWALGRLYNIVDGRKVLLSWGGTMFEYLMPLIFSKQYSDSLIGEACDAAVSCQIAYGKKRGIPWGISESAFSAIDSHKIYQYKSFGVPGLGLKRGLEEDLVVSPYSTALALAVNPKSAIKNFKKLENNLNMLGKYGYFESMDFTRQKSPTGERGVVVSVYMAHHQGMILSAINNTLNNDSLSKRFHKDPRICGVNSLLYERIPFSTPLKITGVRHEPTLRRLEPFSQSPIMGVVETPESVTPKINLLSNGQYSLMITNTGAGYSRMGDIEIYRWRADTTMDSWGSFYYIQDMQSKDLWSATYQPTLNSTKAYSVNFTADKAEFRRKDYQIETVTEVVVSPEDHAEIRLVTLINHSLVTRHIELTSYLELVLATHLADRSHPCFNKLFIETEKLEGLPALIGFRRLRSPDDKPLWAVHVLSTRSEGEIQYETDRSYFIGRGKSLQRPSAMDGDLSNTTGTVLDPIFSLRKRVMIEPGKRVSLSFVTAVTNNRPSALGLIEKYKDLSASHRALELAWGYSQLELRHLRIHQEEVQLFQKLASRLLYPHNQLRTNEERLRKNRLGQSGLWAQGISGDLPIVVVTVGDIYDVDLVKQLLIAHAFWRLRGLKVDLVILNEEEIGYMQPLQEYLQNLIQAHSYLSQIDVPGGVFLRNSGQIPQDQLNLILSVANAILIAARGSLRQQLVSPKQRLTFPPKLFINEKIQEVPSRPLPFLELSNFNGVGGYTADGSSYVIYLGPHMNTPAPWINVLANPKFGTLVSEAGMGFSWYGNSQTNRLTPWSNDPLLNPITDTIYIRDEDLGTVWTPTPAPIRELDPYRITHGQGFTRFEHNSHGVAQELLVFVPTDQKGGLPLRIQRLRLSNHSSRRRRLTITAYSEWVLGNDKEQMQMQVITDWDSECQALFAQNRYNPDFGNSIAFTSSSLPVSSYTADRTEFLGRNRSTSSPIALSRIALSGHTGAALDPCSALQVLVEIDPEGQIEVVFTMGYAQDETMARQLVLQSRTPEKIEQLFSTTQSWWNQTLETIQVDIPDKETTFLLNKWLIYQSLSCRFWGRSGFYQSSGAYGFRDQLQDVMGLLYFLPTLARDYILKAASRQYVEGDVQHWWLSETGAGVRTRCSDDLLWLPFVTAHYVRITGDRSILEETIAFLEGDKLEDDQHEVYQLPTISKEEGTLLEHCRRAIKKGTTSGPHGLPLIGNGDWNDGMNRVGIQGKGESVWLGWFLIQVMKDFSELLNNEGFLTEAKRLAAVIEATSWDGAWYRRAYFDDGTPLGSKISFEASIDSLTQSWAIICGLANPERCATALKSTEEYLVKVKKNLVLLLTPPFDKTPSDPGYIKGYPPGVRENGGQYTHGSAWLSQAYARTGNGNKAVEILRMLSPASHSRNPEETNLYKVEPYVIAADIYDLKNHEGRGGWTWYTGSASWIYRIWLEEILGFKLRGSKLSFHCTIPKEWNEFKIRYRYKSTQYAITVRNPNHLSCGNSRTTLDGVLLSSSEIPLVDDGTPHTVEIVIEEKL